MTTEQIMNNQKKTNLSVNSAENNPPCGESGPGDSPDSPVSEACIQEAVRAGRPIGVRFYALGRDTERVIEKILHGILDHREKMDLVAPVYTALKEMTINGSKANLKRIIFREHRLGFGSDEEYERGMRKFRESLDEALVLDYARRGRKLGLKVEALFFYDQQHLRIEVVNNVAIDPREEKTLREKFARAMKMETLEEYFLNMDTATEGAGMGIGMVVIMFKQLGIDPHGFTISSNHRDSTRARIIIPLSPDYVSDRELFARRQANQKGRSVTQNIA